MAGVEAQLEHGSPDSDLTAPILRRITTGEKKAVRELPDLYNRIEEMGLTQEYCAYRDRFLQWRSGEATGAAGELEAPLLKKGFNGWYPNVNVWTFRRTLSYWIAVGFYIGSIFFTVSSFLGCYPQLLGQYTFAMTKGGYLVGKFYFVICTYFMCVEAVNLRVDEGDDPSVAAEIFYWWPFYYKTAIEKLREAGAGPTPYYCAVSYFIGCLCFTVGLAAEFAPISESVAAPLKLWSFIFGSGLFVVGGICELIETNCFSKFELSLPQFAAALNTVGSGFFLWGSVLGLWPGNEYWGSFTFGVGSALFVVGSAALIVMWKDEQFGLSFFSAINHLISPHGKGSSFSLRGAVFVMIYGVAATLSVYDFMTSMSDFHSVGYQDLVLERAFNCLLPCIVAHLILTLTSAMLRAPKESPYRQIYFGYRFLAVIMIINSGAKVGAKLLRASEGRFLSCVFVSLSPVLSTTAPVAATSASTIAALASTSASTGTITTAAHEVMRGFF